jgi:hypothetical protein
VRAVSDEKAPHEDVPETAPTAAEHEAATAPESEPDARVERTERPARPARKAERQGRSGRREAEAARAKGGAAAPGLLVVIALAAAGAGAAGGWFGRDAQFKAKLRADSAAPAPSGSAAESGPCGAWQSKICAGSGDNSAACMQAKSATDLLTPSTCEVALLAVPATLAKVKAERASCDKLVSKLCADLPPGSQACAMVRERTPAFPRDRCDGMLAHYDEVIGELRQMEQQAGAQLGGAPRIQPGMPPGAPGAHP